MSEGIAPPEASLGQGAQTYPPSTPALWLGFACMALGNFMAILDIQIVASSLREIQAGGVSQCG